MKYLVKFVDSNGHWGELSAFDSLDKAFEEGRDAFAAFDNYAFGIIEDTDWVVRAVIVPSQKADAVIIPVAHHDIYVEKLWGAETIYEDHEGEKLKDEVLIKAKKNPDVEFAMIFNDSDDGYFEGFRKVHVRDQPRLVYIEP